MPSLDAPHPPSPLPAIRFSVPMQRVLRYPLLLKELVKLTPPEHPKLQGLKEALRSLQVREASVSTAGHSDCDHPSP